MQRSLRKQLKKNSEAKVGKDFDDATKIELVQLK